MRVAVTGEGATARVDGVGRMDRMDRMEALGDMVWSAGWTAVTWVNRPGPAELNTRVGRAGLSGKRVGPLGFEPRANGLKGRCSTD